MNQKKYPSPSDLFKHLFTGVILAGGRSSRMGGGDKFLLPLAGTTMLSLVKERIVNQLNSVIISANGDTTRLSPYKLPIVKDEIEGFAGPLAGIHAALSWTIENRPTSTHCLSVAADTPFFPTDFAARMAQEAEKRGTDHIIIATSNGRHQPGFALWPVAAKKPLQLALRNGTRKIRAFTDSMPNTTLRFENFKCGDNEVDPFFNVNKPEEFALCEQYLKGNFKL